MAPRSPVKKASVAKAKAKLASLTIKKSATKRNGDFAERSEKKQRKTYSLKLKKEICKRKLENPDYWTSERLASHFNILDPSSVRRWLSQSNKYLGLVFIRAEDEEKSRQRKTKYPLINEGFAIFVQNAEANSLPLDSILCAWALNYRGRVQPL